MRTIRKSLILTMSLSVCLMTSALPVSALEYTYDSDVPGETFYQATSTDQDYVANSGEIVLGADGTVSTNVTGNVSSGPLSALDMPVGEYPDAWGTAVDVAIAQTSVFPNELGPTSQTTNIYSPVYIPVPVNSGALPTGYGVPANTLVAGTLVSDSTSLCRCDGQLLWHCDFRLCYARYYKGRSYRQTHYPVDWIEQVCL